MHTTLEREALDALALLEPLIHRARSNDSGTARWARTRQDTDKVLALIDRCRSEKAMRLEPEQETGGVYRSDVVPVQVDEVVDVLAGRTEADANGCGRDYWIAKAVWAGYHDDKSAAVEREEFQLVAKLSGSHLHAHLRDCIRAAIGE